MAQLFISYARENKPDVEALVRDLHSLGYQTWLDTSLRGGQSWWHEILQRIADSDVFVAIVSGHTLSSVACKREREWALALNKPVLPLAVDQLPDALPRDLSMRQIVDYAKPGREAALELAGALGTLPPSPPPPEQLPEPPAAPLSYLSELVEQVGQSEPLTQQQQHQILIQLEPALRAADAEERRGGRYVLKVFSRRGDLYADVDRTLAQMNLAEDDAEARGTQWVPASLDAESPSPSPAPSPAPSPQPAAELGGNLLDDSSWADALSAFFAKRWDEAVERFEALQSSYPGERRVETRLKEAHRQRDIGIWSRQAEASAAERDWDGAVTSLEKLSALDPDYPEVGARLDHARTAQRRKALVDEATALHQAGQWSAVVAVSRELARIDPDNSDPGGIVADAQSKLREADLGDRYAQALHHLDDERWQQSADLLAAIERAHPGYRDAAALLKTAQQRLDDTQPFARATKPTPAGTSTPTITPPDRGHRRSGKWIAAAVAGVAVAGALILALVQASKSSDTSTSTPESTATSSAAPTSPQRSGPNETIGDYLKNNNIAATPIVRGAPGAPTIDLPVPDGWTPIPDGPGAPYFGIVFNMPTNPEDKPKITATVEKLTGNVDTEKLLAAAPGEVKNLPGYTGADGKRSTLSGHPTSQLGGPYVKDGVRRIVAQNTVVIPGGDGVYLLQIRAEGLEADADALKTATGVIVQKATIKP